MHINVHVRLQYIILSFFGQIKAFFLKTFPISAKRSPNYCYWHYDSILNLNLKVQWLANNWVIDNVVLWEWLCNAILHMKVM